jgi:hypothetical protein
MNLLNKIFSGGQIEKQVTPNLPADQVEQLTIEPLQPLHGLAAGEAEPIPSLHQAALDSIKEIQQAQARELQRLVHRLLCQMHLAAAARRALARRSVSCIYQAFGVVAAATKRMKARNRWVAKITFDGEVAAKNAAERAARKREREAAQKARKEAREDRETKERLRQERLRSMVRCHHLMTSCPFCCPHLSTILTSSCRSA